MAETYLFIKNLVSDIERGRIRIPSFQRGFVWDLEYISYFIDSIYKGYPFGSILLWRTNNALRTERNIASYKLPQADSKYPIDYVLDGQQRITSIFGIFHNSLNEQEDTKNIWANLFFELNSEEEVPFKYLDNPNDYDPQQFFPLKYVFNSPKYRQITRNLDEELAAQIDDLVSKFEQSRIPIERFEAEEKRNVATVFERVNRRKIDLDIFDLLSVWNWSEEFSLKEKFKEMSSKLDDFGFRGISDDLLLKCSSAVIMNTCKSEAFLDIPGNELSEKCHEIETGLDKAIDFLKSELNIYSMKLLPMENILVVLTSFFASSQKQPPPVSEDKMKAIKRWFWRSCFTERYARGSTKSTNIDLKELCKLKKGEEHKMGIFRCSVDQNYFLEKDFRLSSVRTTTFILLLAQNSPLNFIQGTKISLDKVLSIGDRNEFHHIYPKDYLQKLDKEKINCLANFTFLSRTDNNKIKNDPPSKYKLLMPNDKNILKNILATHLCPIEMFDDDYENFLMIRTQLLVKEANKLCMKFTSLVDFQL